VRLITFGHRQMLEGPGSHLATSRSGRHCAAWGAPDRGHRARGRHCADRPRLCRSVSHPPHQQRRAHRAPGQPSIKVPRSRFGGAACKTQCPGAHSAAVSASPCPSSTSSTSNPAGPGLAQTAAEAAARSASSGVHQMRWIGRSASRAARAGMAAPDHVLGPVHPKRSDSPLAPRTSFPSGPAQQVWSGAPLRARPIQGEGRPPNDGLPPEDGLATKEGAPPKKACPRKWLCRRRTGRPQRQVATNDGLRPKARPIPLRV